jgi:hypothetical protein
VHAARQQVTLLTLWSMGKLTRGEKRATAFQRPCLCRTRFQE